MGNWLEYEAKRLSKKYGYPVSVEDVREIMRDKNRKVKPENRAFAKNKSLSLKANKIRWDKTRREIEDLDGED